MEGIPHRINEVQLDAEGAQNSEARFDDISAEEDREYHVVPFRPLVDFIKFHVDYLPVDTTERDCPVCHENTSDSHERMIQIDLPNCRHVFGADCFERYIQRSHTCPLCREMWFQERLTRETPYRDNRVMIEIIVANQQAADATAEALERFGGEIVGNWRGTRLAEVDDDGNPTESQDPENDEGLNSSNERSTINPPVNSELEAMRTNITYGSGTETESESGTDTETESDISRDVDRAGHARRSSSDDETAARPRQRRRHE